MHVDRPLFFIFLSLCVVLCVCCNGIHRLIVFHEEHEPTRIESTRLCAQVSEGLCLMNTGVTSIGVRLCDYY